jgi:hypothetical protein
MKSIILVTFLLLASIANSAPNCTWKQAETQADIVNDSILAIVGYKCEIKNFDTSLIRDTYKAYILKPNTPQITLEGSNDYNTIKLLKQKKNIKLTIDKVQSLRLSASTRWAITGISKT